MFGSPVVGLIRPPGSPIVVGSFRVTSTFAEHVVSGRGPGVDIGDGQCGSALLAWDDGRVAEVFTAPNGSRVVRVDSFTHPGYQYAIAHMPSFEVWKGKLVTRGQIIGHVGSSGGVPCHAHLGLKHNGVEIDSWPLFDQNMGADMAEPIPSAAYTLLINKITATENAVNNFRVDRRLASPVIRQLPAGTVFRPIAIAHDGDAAGGATPTDWLFGMLYDDSPVGYVFGCFHSSLLAPLRDDLATDCGPAIADAKRVWNAKIDAAQL